MSTPLALSQATAPPPVRQPGVSAHLPREFLSFRLGAEEYGVDILRVQEIRRYEAPTRIANAPAFVKGVINLRGIIVPLVDLRLKFGCEGVEYTDFTIVIVLNVKGRTVGAVVDSVSDVLALDADTIKPPPGMNSRIDAGHIIGVGCPKGEDGRMLILSDIEAMMGSGEVEGIDAGH